uniref:EGF-like domain-containing protein n=1 Tax=Timema cristinae TaxID=61476 RepID=A0A7R9GPY0_TIMCR|nr:unnamed protein product [Timema cristinae]
MRLTSHSTCLLLALPVEHPSLRRECVVGQHAIRTPLLTPPPSHVGVFHLKRRQQTGTDCDKEDGVKCQNGACLDSQCHCNDGFGGCSCEVPDENECKYRPCDVFAHCTNTLGSFHCTCFPGYMGDGFACEAYLSALLYRRNRSQETSARTLRSSAAGAEP